MEGQTYYKMCAQKNVLVVGIDENISIATSNIVTRIFANVLRLEPNSINVVSVGYGSANKKRIIDEKFISYLIKYPFGNGASGFFRRIINKIASSLNFDIPLYSYKYLLKKTNKIVKNIDDEIDVVFGVSGLFYYMETAYCLSKKLNKKFVMMYFDPFTNNALTKNKKVRIAKEKEWCECASSIYYDQAGEKPPFNEKEILKKIKPFEIPIFSNCEKTKNTTNDVVYGGIFYSGFREPKIIESFLEINNCLDYAIHLYSNAKSLSKEYKNVFLHDVIDFDKYSEICRQSFAIIVIGNGNKKIIPSKIVEAIGFRKPIIILNFQSVPAILKDYPLFFNGEEAGVFEKIKRAIASIRPEEIDLKVLYPSRNPDIVSNLIINDVLQN